MGYFSELNIELEPKKDYLRTRGIPNDREMTQEEYIEEQMCLWEQNNKPKPLTKKEELAVLNDDISSPHWKTAINKLIPGAIPTSYQYTKKRN